MKTLVTTRSVALPCTCQAWNISTPLATHVYPLHPENRSLCGSQPFDFAAITIYDLYESCDKIRRERKGRKTDTTTLALTVFLHRSFSLHYTIPLSFPPTSILRNSHATPPRHRLVCSCRHELSSAHEDPPASYGPLAPPLRS